MQLTSTGSFASTAETAGARLPAGTAQAMALAGCNGLRCSYWWGRCWPDEPQASVIWEASVTLVRSYEFNHAVVATVVEPIDKGTRRLTSLAIAAKQPTGVVGAVFDRGYEDLWYKY